jgi:hypothetical protein
VSVELEKLDSDQEGGLDFKTISYLDRVYTTVTTETFDAGLSFLHEHFTDCVIYINVTKLEDLQQIILPPTQIPGGKQAAVGSLPANICS